MKYARILFVGTDRHSSGQKISVIFYNPKFVRFESSITAFSKIQFFWNVTPFGLESSF